MLARGDIGLRLFRAGLLDKFGDRKDALGAVQFAAAPDVAIAGLGALRRDAKADQRAGARRGCGAFDGVGKGREIADRVVGRHDQHQRIGFRLGQRQGGDAGGGGRVAADRLEQERARNGRDLAQLLGDDEPMLFIGDQQGRGEALPVGHPANRLLQQAVAAEEAQQLFRVKRARHRPEPCTRAAGQNDGMNHASSSWPTGRTYSTFAEALCRHTPFSRSRKCCLLFYKKNLTERSGAAAADVNGTNRHGGWHGRVETSGIGQAHSSCRETTRGQPAASTCATTRNRREPAAQARPITGPNGYLNALPNSASNG